jgi:hypothetical protein
VGLRGAAPVDLAEVPGATQGDRVRRPGRSAHNPDGLEERTILAADVFDVSITPRPAYPRTLVALRSGPQREPGTIWRAAPPVVLAPAWALEAPNLRQRDYIGDPDYPPLALPACLRRKPSRCHD